MDINNLIEILNIKAKDTGIISQAFIHRSYLNESKKRVQSNERLEFLGDCIISYVISEYLYKSYPRLSEGELTNLRSGAVKTSTLAAVADQLSLGSLLYLSKGEEESGGRKNFSILADTFEAMIGAVYMDQGLDRTTRIIIKYLTPYITDIMRKGLKKDEKSAFQEKVQETVKSSPVYKVLNEEGPDHSKKFTIGVYVGNSLWGRGEGKNKQEAEQNAARDALEKWSKKEYNT